MRLSEKNHPALVLSGGGIKAAAFHIGVCLALREKGFSFAGGNKSHVENTSQLNQKLTFQTYVGSSAGAVMSTFLACGFSIDAIIDAFTQGQGLPSVARKAHPLELSQSYLKPLGYKDLFSINIKSGVSSNILSRFLNKKPVIQGGFEVLLKQGFKVNGIFTMKNLEKYLQENVTGDNKFSSLGVQLFIVATQLNHSRKVVFGNYDETTKTEQMKYAGFASISQAVCASASLPPVFSPYGIHNHKGREIFFFDGEIRDTLSTHVAAEHGADLVIASYSMQPYHYNPEMGSLHEYGIPAILNQALNQLVQQKIESHRRHRLRMGSMIQTVNGYLKQIDLPADQREKLIEILIEKTQHDPNVEFIYIHPSPEDYEMFFADHFSLNPKILSKIVHIGFKSAMRTLRKYNI